MTAFLHIVRFVLPTLFFGYGIAANLAVLMGPPPEYALPDDGLLSGGLTRDIDGLYKEKLPHMDLSYGLIGAARYALLQEARSGAVVGKDGWLFSSEEARAVPSDASVAEIVDTVLTVQQRLRAAGTDLVVVPLPAKIDVYREHSPDQMFGNALATLFETFAGRLADRGIKVVNARAALAAHGPDAQMFFATDTHWTPEGAATVANAVAGSNMLAQGDLRFARADVEEKALTGDLIRFVTTSTLAARVGLPSETFVPIVQTPLDVAGDIFGAAAADIVLIGTSYSANSDWGFADALMLALGRDVLSMAEQGKGPLQPMQDYLNSAGFKDAPPKVVIWEIPVRFLTDPAIWPGPALSGDAKIANLRPSEENPDG